MASLMRVIDPVYGARMGHGDPYCRYKILWTARRARIQPRLWPRKTEVMYPSAFRRSIDAVIRGYVSIGYQLR